MTVKLIAASRHDLPNLWQFSLYENHQTIRNTSMHW